MSKALFNVDAPGEYSGINISKAKAKWSFPKNSRFPKAKESYCATAAYEIIKNNGTTGGVKKGAAFGYGNRFKYGNSKLLKLSSSLLTLYLLHLFNS